MIERPTPVEVERLAEFAIGARPGEQRRALFAVLRHDGTEIRSSSDGDLAFDAYVGDERVGIIRHDGAGWVIEALP